MARAYSPTEIKKMKKKVLDFEGAWFEAFRKPERVGVWFIWGKSGNGKSSFVMQLCKELTKYGKVLYNSLEEGVCLTMQESIERHGMDDKEIARRFQILDCEPMDELSERLSKHKSADFVVIDSFQYTQMNYLEYLSFRKQHRNKLLIFISHADGSKPSGRSAVSVHYDAGLKIWVEGFRAISKGRSIGDRGYFTIWNDGAAKYWGEEFKNDKQENI